MIIKKNYSPIAIVGMACRFSGGANSLEQFWVNLNRGVDEICEIPESRWDPRRFYSTNKNKSGKTYVKAGGFLQEDISHFDPMFFGISPREAEVMDPQQRILFEVTWEAIEDAGYQLPYLQRIKTGVFIGGFCLDHKILNLSPHNQTLINTHSGAGPLSLQQHLEW